MGDDGTTKLWETMDRVVGNNVNFIRMIFDREDAPPKATDNKRADGSKKGERRTMSKKTKTWE